MKSANRAQSAPAGPEPREAPAARAGSGAHAELEPGRTLRIGEVAELTGTTPRTIRYYEEIGLLRGAERAHGKHRCYSEGDVERVREIVRLRDLLGLSLEQLSQLLEAETARAEFRREYHRTDQPAKRRRILEQALGHIATQLELVRGRRTEIERLEHDLLERKDRLESALVELEEPAPAYH